MAFPAASAHRFAGAILAAGALGWAIVALGLLFRIPWLLGWGLALFGAEYATFVRLRGGAVDGRSVFVAAMLLLVAELAFFSIQVRVPSADRGLTVRRTLALIAALIGTGFAGGLVLVISGSANSGVGVEAAGAVAAVLAIAMVVRIAARSRDSTST